MVDPGHGLSGGELGRPPPGLQLARGTAGPRPGKHPRPAVVLSLGATAMEIRCPQISAFVDYCSLSVHSQRQRPCLENESQCCCVCGLSRGACSIGELRWRAGRFMHSSPASGRERGFRPPFHRVCPSGKMQSNLPEWQSQLWHLVKVARVVCGEKTKQGGPES